MKKHNFLGKMKQENKIELVESSDDICSSYLKKAGNSLKSAKILIKSDLFENSVSMAYYAMYNSLMSLFFKIGIKSENHSASIILFKKLLNRNDLFELISKAKKERIDKQYYVDSEDNADLSKESAETMIKTAEEFSVQIKIIIDRLSMQEISSLRKKFEEIT